MKKIALITAICLLVVMSMMVLVACGGDKDKGGNGPATFAAAKEKLGGMGYVEFYVDEWNDETKQAYPDYAGAVGYIKATRENRSGENNMALLFGSAAEAKACFDKVYAPLLEEWQEEGMVAELFGSWLLVGTIEGGFVEDFKK